MIPHAAAIRTLAACVVSISGIYFCSGLAVHAEDMEVEVELFLLAERGRFQELMDLLTAQPEDAAYTKPLAARAQRLLKIRETMLDRIRSAKDGVPWNEVDPDSAKGGVIAGISGDRLKVVDGGSTRRVILNGLSAQAQFRLAKAYLKDDAKGDPALLPDLAEALGLSDALKAVDPKRAELLELIASLRAALSKGAIEDAEKAAGRITTTAGNNPWAALALHWIQEVRRDLEDRRKRKTAVLEGYPKETVVHFWEDYELGPTMLSEQWRRGEFVRLPAPDATNRWCHQSSMVAKGMAWGEMLVGIRHPASRSQPGQLVDNPEELCRLGENLTLEFKIWTDNADRLELHLFGWDDAKGQLVSVLEIPKVDQKKWVPIKMALGNLKGHKRHRDIQAPVLKLGTPLKEVDWTANRADRTVETGQFYVDDIVLYTLPAGEKPNDSKAVSPPLPPDEEF